MIQWKRAVLAVLALTTIGLGVGAGPAHASHAAPDLPVATEPCRDDLSPTWPSCVPDLRLLSGSGTTAIDVDTRLVCDVDYCAFLTTTCLEVNGKEYCNTTSTPKGRP